MSDPIDLDDVRRHAMSLTSGTCETPRIDYLYQGAGCVVSTDGVVFAVVPPHDGQQRPEVAEAIAAAGPLLLALVAEVERLRDPVRTMTLECERNEEAGAIVCRHCGKPFVEGDFCKALVEATCAGLAREIGAGQQEHADAVVALAKAEAKVERLQKSIGRLLGNGP